MSFIQFFCDVSRITSSYQKMKTVREQTKNLSTNVPWPSLGTIFPESGFSDDISVSFITPQGVMKPEVDSKKLTEEIVREDATLYEIRVPAYQGENEHVPNGCTVFRMLSKYACVAEDEGNIEQGGQKKRAHKPVEKQIK
uniref:Uncharacterized protein n=1 Tax=Aplanochytrium stocchinoi TaxID=215587 RepID=A0A7S3PRM8_9STRA|mmetsp:Transcript_12879/g.16728  ORF Transcript_12879/g.16728 Transcript_12879/m.16728 type:complete len:140 (+) Transcript_12879:127-546(+)